MQSELLPCPFCDGEGAYGCYDGEFFEHWVRCVECHASVSENDPEVNVCEAWNRRASPWRPISEAPHDGTRVDVWGGARVPDALWLDDSALPGWVMGPTFAEPHGAEYVYLDPQPTHFMPVPEGPTSTIRNKD